MAGFSKNEAAGCRSSLGFRARFAGPQNQADRARGHARRMAVHLEQSNSHKLRQIVLGKFSSWCVCGVVIKNWCRSWR